MTGLLTLSLLLELSVTHFHLQLTPVTAVKLLLNHTWMCWKQHFKSTYHEYSNQMIPLYIYTTDWCNGWWSCYSLDVSSFVLDLCILSGQVGVILCLLFLECHLYDSTFSCRSATATDTCTVLCFVVIDISDTQKPGANVDGTQFVAQVFAVWLPAQVVASAKQSAIASAMTARHRVHWKATAAR